VCHRCAVRWRETKETIHEKREWDIDPGVTNREDSTVAYEALGFLQTGALPGCATLALEGLLELHPAPVRLVRLGARREVPTRAPGVPPRPLPSDLVKVATLMPATRLPVRLDLLLHRLVPIYPAYKTTMASLGQEHAIRFRGRASTGLD
jgi:hypothetical protein